MRRGTTRPFDIAQVDRCEGVTGHGTEISATKAQSVGIDAEEARQIIGTRFLADPGFQVSLDGTRVTFADVLPIRLKEIKVPVPPYGTAELIILDTLKADSTTQQHGIARRVKNRLVGTPGWVGFDDERVLDGRRSEAKRFQVIVVADFLGTVVSPDWKGFEPEAETWQTTRATVHAAIHDYLVTFTEAKRDEANRNRPLPCSIVSLKQARCHILISLRPRRPHPPRSMPIHPPLPGRRSSLRHRQRESASRHRSPAGPARPARRLPCRRQCRR